MNYFQQVRAFRILRKTCQLASPEIALWFAFASISNELGKYERLSLAESTLMEEAGLSRSGLYRARNRLKQHGFILWNSRKGNQAALYTMIDLTTVLQYGAQNRAQSGTQDGAQYGAQSDAIYLRNQEEQNDYQKNSSDNPLNINDAWKYSTRARAAVAQRILDRWETLKGREDQLAGTDANWVLCGFMEVGMTPEQILSTLQGCKIPYYFWHHLFTEALHLGIADDECFIKPPHYGEAL